MSLEDEEAMHLEEVEEAMQIEVEHLAKLR
jgi:hypothetical protein